MKISLRRWTSTGIEILMIAGLLIACGAGAYVLAEEGETNMPRLSMRLSDTSSSIIVKHSPDDKEYLWLIWPEGFFTDGLGLPGRYIQGEQILWQHVGEGHCFQEAVTEEGVAQRITLRAYHDYIDFQITITNNATAPVGPGLLFTCTDFRVISSIGKDDDTMNRAYVRVNGEWTKIIDTERTLALDGNIIVYYMKDTPVCSKFPLEEQAPYGWGTSQDRVDHPLIALESKDGQMTVATMTPHPNTLTFNIKSVHGCIHSNPSIPEIPPGQTRTVLVRTYWAEGNFQQLLPRFEKDLKELTEREDALNVVAL